jgi:hypothetical protein
MSYDFLENNPLLSSMSPEKLAFLMDFAGSQKPQSSKEMVPFLLASMTRAKKSSIRFTKEETELLFQILKQNMSPEEAAKAEKMMELLHHQMLATST